LDTLVKSLFYLIQPLKKMLS